MLLENKSDIRYVHYMMMYVLHVKWFPETSSSTLHVQLKEILNEDVGQDETLSEVIAVLETNDYNSNIENIVEEVYTAVNM
jgi:hypothetical protein